MELYNVDGLQLIGDGPMTDLIGHADQEYLTNRDYFIKQGELNDSEPL